MKKRYLILACLIPVGVWYFVSWLVINFANRFVSYIPDCQKEVISEKCKTWFAILGQTGDSFGIANSLFSGLALFAVAATVWADYSARRSSRKPLVVCSIDKNNEVVFDEPSYTAPRSVRLKISLRVKVENDTALNTSVKATFKVGDFILRFEDKHVQAPLIPGGYTDMDFLVRIDSAGISKMIKQIEDINKMMVLEVEANCNSIEGVSWKTSVCYQLKFVNNDLDKIRKLSHDDASLATAWVAGAAVGLGYEVIPGSWKYVSI